MVFGTPTFQVKPGHKSLPFTCVLTLFIAAAPILVLGVYQPRSLQDLLQLAAAQLGPLGSP
jgi:hypothetical protein